MKKVNLLMGRFQPFTLGHMKCVDAAAEKGLKTVIAQIETKVSDKKHPFTDADIEGVMQDLIKTTPDIIDIIKVKSADIVKIGEEFKNNGYEIAGWTCGTDRIDSYTKMSSKYAMQAGLTDDFQMIEVKRGDEDISATKVRNAMLADDKATFEKLTPKCFHKYYGRLQAILKNVYENRLRSLSEYLCEALNEGLGIKGEPKKGIIYRDKAEGLVVKYDPNTQYITLFYDGLKTDSFDCSSYSTWDEVVADFEDDFGFSIKK